MTMIRDIEMKCGACGKTSSQPVLLSTNCWGSPDLDLRPSEMKRSTMNMWVLECPHCGYVASDIEREPEIPMDFLKTEEYLTCDGFEFEGNIAKKFFKNYLISKQSSNIPGCFFNLLRCAWDCDDKKDVKNAIKIRKLALTYVDDAISQFEGDEKNNFLLIKADVLRRSGEFDKLVEEYKDLIIGEELLDRIITFQILKAREGDDACYTVEDVEEALS